jgi:hypothetical protein
LTRNTLSVSSHARIIPWRELAVLVAFIAMTLVFTYPAVRCLSRCVANSGDPLLNSWILAWDARGIVQNPLGVFDANIFYPFSSTLAYSESQMANALLAMPVWLISQNAILAHNWIFLSSFVLSGFGMYLLVKHLAGSGWVGLVSGIIFAFSSYRIAHFTQIQMLATQWMPFALLFLDRWLCQQKWLDVLAFTLFFNLQALSSYYYALFFGLAVAVMLLFYIILRRGARWSRRLVVQGVCFGVLTLIVNVPLATPYFELSRTGLVRSKETTQLFQAEWTDYLATTPWNRLYGSITAPLRGDYWSEHVFFPGSLAIILALLGLSYHLFRTRGRGGHTDMNNAGPELAPPRSNVVLMYACLLLIAMVLAMGTTWRLPGTDVELKMPFGWLFDHVPGFQGLRAPSRFSVISILALAVLSGYGAAVIRTRMKMLSPIPNVIILLFLPLAIGVENLAIPLPYAAAVPAQVPEVYRWLADLPDDTVVIELPFSSTEDGRPDWGTFPYVEGWRVYFSTFHWKSIVNGYSGFHPPGYQEFVGEMIGFPDGPSISRLNEIGIDYVLLHRDMYDAQEWSETEDALRDYRAELVPARDFGETLVLAVIPQGSQAVRQLLETASFGQKMALIGYGVDQRPLRPGESFTLSLLWRAVDEMGEDYTVFTHVVDSKGTLVAQHDGPPQGGRAPTSGWHKGQITRDQHQLTVSDDVAPGVYKVSIGVYSWPTIERLSVIDEDGRVIDDNINVMELMIVGD